MKNHHYVIILTLLNIYNTVAQGTKHNAQEEADKKAIIAVMDAQQKAWSNYDLEGFMEGYWKSDALKFYSGGIVQKGWKNTLDRYKKAYPSKEATGTLTFGIKDIAKISKDSYSVMGTYHLKRAVGDANGVFMIIFKKIKGKWKIIADSSC